MDPIKSRLGMVFLVLSFQFKDTAPTGSGQENGRTQHHIV